MTTMHYSHTSGNPYAVRPNKAMLSKDGFFQLRNVKNRSTGKHELIEVHYPKEYVYSFFWKQIINALALFSEQEILELYKETIEWKKQQQSQENAE